jgi:ribonuclease T2
VRRILLPFLALILAGCSEGDAGGAPFDFYVLALSWSPSYCAQEGGEADAAQCRNGGRQGLVLHGLWPQHERGYPEFCPLNDDGRFSRRELAALRDLFPSSALIRHQWRKHGSCTGLSRQDYFGAIRAALGRVRIPDLLAGGRRLVLSPDRIEDAFIAANPGLSREAMAVTCRSGLLREIRICLTREFGFRPCPEIDRGGCRAKRTVLPAAG